LFKFLIGGEEVVGTTFKAVNIDAVCPNNNFRLVVEVVVDINVVWALVVAVVTTWGMGNAIASPDKSPTSIT
jgi:hypothetical protein